MFKHVFIGSCGRSTRYNREIHLTWVLHSKVSSQEKCDRAVTPLNYFYTVTLQSMLPNSLSSNIIFNKHSTPKLLNIFLLEELVYFGSFSSYLRVITVKDLISLV